MKEHFYIKKIKIPLYRNYVSIIVTNSIKKLSKYDAYNDIIYAHSLIGCIDDREMPIMVLNFDNEHTRITHGVISHEVTHIVNFILNDRGVIADHNNDEPMCYLIEWLTNEVYLFLNKIKFKPDIKY